MRRYLFRLQSVLKVREIQESVAAANLAIANRDLAAAEAALTARRSAYAALEVHRGVQACNAFMASRELDALKAQALVEADAEVARRDVDADGRRAEWTTAAARVTALENLDERNRDAHAVEATRHDANVVDDVVVSRYRSTT